MAGPYKYKERPTEEQNKKLQRLLRSAYTCGILRQVDTSGIYCSFDKFAGDRGALCNLGGALSQTESGGQDLPEPEES